MGTRYQEEIDHQAAILAEILHTKKVSRRDIESQLSLSRGYLSKLLKGEVDLKVSQVVGILEAVGYSVRSFYKLLYRFSPQKIEGVSAEVKLAIQEELQPTPVTEGSRQQPAELEDAVRSVLRRLLKDSVGD
jgi:transcriptional regulator with XRE-family HTH domain